LPELSDDDDQGDGGAVDSIAASILVKGQRGCVGRFMT
jgi:hypothetical protein